MELNEREMNVTAMVTVTIPVNLAFDGPVSWDEMRRAALANFLDHPAVKTPEDEDDYRLGDLGTLGMFVDRIEVTHG